MNYILFDPVETWENLLPLTFTRPVSEIRLGILTIREKWENQLETTTSWLSRDHLQAKFITRLEDENVLINGSVLPDPSFIKLISRLEQGQTLVQDGIILATRLPRQEVDIFNPDEYPAGKVIEAGHMPTRIEHPWDIFRMNGEAISDDFKLLTHGRKSAGISETNRCLEPEQIFLEEGASVECAILNARTGPIYIGKDAEIMEGAMIRGPFALGEQSTVKLGAKIYGPTTIGPYSKAGGEINNSVILGYSNKGHDGFLGNSVIGEWCNIGADSNNSNLKNNYSVVKVWNYREERFIETGLYFCGLFMGDHSKCGINTMFNTGTVVGVNANIFGDGFPRTFIPSFSWGGPQGFTAFQIDKAFVVAEEVMKRRDVEFSDTDKDLLTSVYTLTEKYRS